MPRKPGYIKPVKNDKQPTNLIFFDTETFINDDGKGNFDFPIRLGVITYVTLDSESNIKRRKQEVFYSIDEFINLLETYLRPKSTYYIFAHNIGFDIRVLNLVTELHNRGFDSKPPIINERVFIWDVRLKTIKMMFLDTANLGVMSVSQLGQDLGFDKLSVDFDTVSNDDLVTYCKRDVDILETFVLKYIRYLVDNNFGTFKSTLAGQALYAYRKRFITNPPFIHTNDSALKLERDGYHGGRVEAYHIGNLPKGDYYYLDINSMYPYAMSSSNLPVKFMGYTENVKPAYLKARLARSYVIADVTINTELPIYSIIKDHKLIFPVGTFRAVLHHDELVRAVKDNSILAIHRCAVYERKDIFTKYVDFLYNEKIAHTISGNKTYRYITKLFLNSLYGKFGQLNPHREFIYEDDSNVVWRVPGVNRETGLHYQEINWFGKVYLEYKEGETTLSNPAIAGAITASSRYLLWSYVELAGLDNVFYCDTDSLIVNQSGYDKLLPYIDPTKLGMLKLEDQGKNVSIWGNKDYVFEDTVKVKGVPKSAVELGEGLWEYIQFQGFRTWLNDGANGSPKGSKLTKRRRTSYNKGEVTKSGKVKPFTIQPNRVSDYLVSVGTVKE